ncbi:MAG: hypothetical protein PWP15_155 [Methanothermococcus sp.]|uniref:hypothetical protein n=1 Tax=Methanothermococcus sp. TaxID=2614238 RepID=UPI002585B0EE|nr:hypothetical protein [Methanothermococcus sp.]MDK2789648.1 hypothetical protein [Methanothermococcus sp.]
MTTQTENKQNDGIEELKKNIEQAYLKFKSYIYYDNTLPHIRMKLAEFEANNNVENKFEELAKAIIDYNGGKTELNEYLEDINYMILPKKVEKPKYPSNIYKNHAKFGKYEVEDYNIFIDCPIEIHLISVLWIMKIGHKLDEVLSNNVKGYRLVRNEYECFEKDNKFRLFEKYHEKYSSFRDDAIKKAIKCYKDKSDVILINIDINKFFYNISFDFKELSKNEEDEFNKKLNNIMSKIHEEFQNRLKEDKFVDDIIDNGIFKYVYANENKDDNNFNNIKLDKDNAEKRILPIGLLSSSIIANYALKDFDDIIIKKVKPEYYGRYVDDMLFVFANEYVEELEIDKYNNPIDEYDEKLKIAKILESVINCNMKGCGNRLIKYCNCKINYEEKKCGKTKDEVVIYFEIKNDEKDETKKIENTFLINSNKVKIYDFDKNDPIYLLEEYSKQITRNRSIFKTLPEDDDMSSTLGSSPINIKYSSSSKNRLSSIDGHSLDHFLLSTNLSKNIIYKFLRAKLPDEDINKYNQTIKYIFSGAEVLEILRLWEKIFTYYIISKNEKELVSAVNDLLDIISNIEYKNKDEDGERVINQKIVEKMKEDLEYYLSHSLAIAIGLDPKFYNKKLKNELEKLNKNKLGRLYKFKDELNKCVEENEKIDSLFSRALNLIKSNLIRHYYIPNSLFNYCEFKDDDFKSISFVNKKHDYLTKKRKNNGEYEIYNIDGNKIKYSPRYIHHHEKILFYKRFLSWAKGKDVNYKDIYNNKSKIFNYDDNKSPDNSTESEQYYRIFIKDKKESKKDELNKDDINITYYIIQHDEKDAPKSLNIGIANIAVDKNDTFNSVYGNPNHNNSRLDAIYHILNMANDSKHKCDVLIFPEVSIPVEWMDILIDYSRKNSIAVIFGIEHFSVDSNVYNYTCIALPFKDDEYKHVFVKFNLKLHGAPAENEEINHNHHKPDVCYNLIDRCGINEDNHEIDVFVWRGTYFSVFNCYELADIEYRSKLVGKNDYTIAIEYNGDLNYFSSIVESISRDVHSYMIQVNNSKYGDSRITQPSKTEIKDIVKIKGGDNATLIVGKIDIQSLRDFQHQSYSLQKMDKRFKPTPPNYYNKMHSGRKRIP